MTLNDKQWIAIDALVAGKKGVEVEAMADVSHAQFARWKKEEEFIERWEAERLAQHQARVDNFYSLNDPAVATVRTAIEEGDTKTALEIVKLQAPALSDVRRVPPATSDESTPEAPPQLNEHSTVHVCEVCGKECKSAGALGSHRRAHRRPSS